MTEVSQTNLASSAEWKALALSVIDSVSSHAVRSDPAEYERFHEDLKQLAGSLQNEPDPAAVLVSAGALAQKIEYYFTNTQTTADCAVAELRKMVRSLIALVVETRSGTERALAELQEAAQTIETAAGAEQWRIAGLRLSHALEGFTHAADPAGANEPLIAAAPVLSVTRVSAAAAAAAPAPGPAESQEWQLDPSTGLPNEAAAREAILALDASPANRYVSIFQVKQLAQINARFGVKTGNEVLSACAQRVAEALPVSSDRLFRWRGAAFVALLEREESLAEVRREIRQIVPSRLQHEFRNGTALLWVALVSETFCAETYGAVAILEEIQKFCLATAGSEIAAAVGGNRRVR